MSYFLFPYIAQTDNIQNILNVAGAVQSYTDTFQFQIIISGHIRVKPRCFNQYAELESKVAEISAANDEAAASLKDVEHRLGNMAVLIKNLTTYKQLRPVVLEYRKAKDKAAFRREHESQLILYEAAAKAIKDAGITRLPDLAALKAEYRELDKQKARLYEQYGEVKRELKEYGIIKQNVDSILRVTPGKEQAQEL